MKREEIKNILGEGAADEVVTKLLDALHAEIEPHKTAAKTAQDALAAKVAEINELSKKTTDADELKKQLNDLKAKYDAETKEAAEKLAEYGHCIGMAFQIRDDMFDYSDEASVIGKPVGIDLDEQKITMPLLGALSSVDAGKAAQIRSKVVAIHGNPSLKDEVRSFVLENGGLEYSKARLSEYVAAAERALDALPPSEEKELLAGIASFTASRNR